MMNVQGREHGLRGACHCTGAVLAEFVLAFPVVLVLIFAVIQFAHICMARLVVHYAAFCAARSALVHVCSSVPPGVDFDSVPARAELAACGYPGLAPALCGNSSIGAALQGVPRSEAEYVACETAARVCSVVTMGESPAEASLRSTADPGVNAQFGAARRKTRATLDFDVDTWTVTARVEHDFGLVVPIVGQMIGWGVSLWGDNAYQRADAADDMDATDGAHTAADGNWEMPHLRLTETVLLSKPWHTLIPARNWRYP